MASNVSNRTTGERDKALAKLHETTPADQVSMADREAAALAKMAGSTEIIRTEGTEEKRNAS